MIPRAFLIAPNAQPGGCNKLMPRWRCIEGAKQKAPTIYLLIVALAAVLLLTGCAGVNTAQSIIADRGAQVSDEARESAEFVLCRGISVGSWVRAYGQTKERAEAWKALCSVKIEQTP